MQRFSLIHLAIVVALILAMAGAVAFAATHHTPTDQQVFRVAVDSKGHMRLLSPESDESDGWSGNKHSDKHGSKEFVIELASSSSVATLQGLLTALQDSVSDLESSSTTLEDLLTALQDQVSDLESRVSALESENPGGGGNPPDQSIVLWLPMNEGNGTVAYDLSDYGNNGTIHGATWVVENGHNVLTFDGVDDYVVVANDSSLDITGDLTIEFWSKYVSGSQNYRVISKPMDSGDSSWGIVFYHGDGGAMTWYYNNKYARDSATPTAGTWYHFVGVFDSSASELRLYQDGNLVATKAGVPAQATNDGNLYVGWGRVDSNYYPGSVASLRIYNRALSADEIMANYSAEAGQYP